MNTAAYTSAQHGSAPSPAGSSVAGSGNLSPRLKNLGVDKTS
jgi:hypothetical protein